MKSIVYVNISLALYVLFSTKGNMKKTGKTSPITTGDICAAVVDRSFEKCRQRESMIEVETKIQSPILAYRVGVACGAL